MKQLTTAVLFATMSLAPVFAANQAKTTPAPSTANKTETAKTTKPAKSHGKRHHKKHTTTSTNAPAAKK